MISAFFINRPVLANVLAIVIVLIGGVALMTLPVAQYPNVVPPTVQVTTTYPGASAKVVVDNVALPVELQVNGVEKMIYMQSYSTDAGTYTLTVTFEIGTDLDFAQVLVQNKVSAALASLPMSGPGARPDRRKEVDVDPPDRVADLAGPALRQPLSQQLRDHQPGQRTVAPAGRRQRQRAGRRPVLDARLARSGEALHLRPHAIRRHPRHPAAEPGRERGPGRHAAGAKGAGLPVHDRRRRPPQHARGIQQHHRQGRPGQWRPDRPRQGHRPRRPRRPDIRPDLADQRQAQLRHRHLPAARCQRARRRQARQRQDGRAFQELPARPRLRVCRSTPPASCMRRSGRSS